MYQKYLLLFILFCSSNLFAKEYENIVKYLEYLPASNFGKRGDYTKGEMQIIDQYDSIVQVQQQYYNEFLQRGYSPVEAEKYSRVGIVEEDRYWLWVRDPLILPNGKTTAYNRLLARNGLHGVAGVSVMGISKDNKVLVNVIFRHATREWEIEIPRGGREKNETTEQAAIRELSEETGVRADSALKIASIAPDSGVQSSLLDLFVVKDFLSIDGADREECEAIYDCVFLSKQELKRAFVDGFIELNLHGHQVKVYCRDPFLASAILIAETKGLF